MTLPPPPENAIYLSYLNEKLERGMVSVRFIEVHCINNKSFVHDIPILGSPASKEGDIYSLCSIIWELCTGTVLLKVNQSRPRVH